MYEIKIIITRNFSDVYATAVKTDFGKIGISYTGPFLWNQVLGVGINPGIMECAYQNYRQL